MYIDIQSTLIYSRMVSDDVVSDIDICAYIVAADDCSDFYNEEG